MEYNFTEIGNRIREIRKENGISQDELIDRFKNHYDFPIARNTLSKIENGEKKAFSFEFFYTFSKMFDCDIGFLLGEYKEQKQESHYICSVTGLSENAINKIVTWKNTDDYHRFWNDYISSIIESEDSEKLFSYISKVLGFSKWEAKSLQDNNVNQAIEFIDMQTAQLWYATKTFTDIIEEICRDIRMRTAKDNG